MSTAVAPSPKNESKLKPMRQESRVGMFFVNAWLIFFAVISIVPMLWLVLAASKSDPELSTRNPLAFGSLKGYWNAWQNLQFFDNGVIGRGF